MIKLNHSTEFKPFKFVCYDCYMKEVVWVMGASGSGKETFIQSALTDKQIAEQLGWSGKIVVACEASLMYIGQFDGDPIAEQREQIFSEVQTLLQDADVVLIKWQYADITADRTEALRRLLPGVRHRIIELQAPLSELIERLKNKPWWHDQDIGKEIAFITSSLKGVFKATKHLKNFEMTRLDSGVSGDYGIIQ